MKSTKCFSPLLTAEVTHHTTPSTRMSDLSLSLEKRIPYILLDFYKKGNSFALLSYSI